MFTEVKGNNGEIMIKGLPKELQPALAKFDVDGDGTINPSELGVAAQMYEDSLKKQKQLKKIIVAVVFFSMAICGLLLGLMMAANEASKDSKPDDDGVLKTIKGDAIATKTIMNSMSLNKLPYLEMKDLKEVKSLSLAIGSGTSHYTITGFDITTDKTSLKLYTSRGDIIEISNGVVHVMHPDGKSTKVARRHLLAAGQDTADISDLPLEFKCPRDMVECTTGPMPCAPSWQECTEVPPLDIAAGPTSAARLSFEDSYEEY